MEEAVKVNYSVAQNTCSVHLSSAGCGILLLDLPQDPREPGTHQCSFHSSYWHLRCDDALENIHSIVTWNITKEAICRPKVDCEWVK